MIYSSEGQSIRLAMNDHFVPIFRDASECLRERFKDSGKVVKLYIVRLKLLVETDV